MPSDRALQMLPAKIPIWIGALNLPDPVSLSRHRCLPEAPGIECVGVTVANVIC